MKRNKRHSRMFLQVIKKSTDSLNKGSDCFLRQAGLFFRKNQTTSSYWRNPFAMHGHNVHNVCDAMTFFRNFIVERDSSDEKLMIAINFAENGILSKRIQSVHQDGSYIYAHPDHFALSAFRSEGPNAILES